MQFSLDYRQEVYDTFPLKRGSNYASFVNFEGHWKCGSKVAKYLIDFDQTYANQHGSKCGVVALLNCPDKSAARFELKFS